MEERPPRRPREAWAESGAPREGTPPPEPYEVTEVQPLHADADCLPPHGEEEDDEVQKNGEAINTIERFLRSTGEDNTLNMMFLESICTICSIGIKRGLCGRVATFCHKKNLAEKVKTLNAIDNMLQMLMVNSYTFRQETLQNILEQLRRFLEPPQRTDIVLMTLEKTTGDCRVEDSERAKIILDRILTEPGNWLMDVPEIMGFLHRHLKTNKTRVEQEVFSALEMMAHSFPRDVLTSVLIHLPQCDSTLDIWKRVLSFPLSSERVLEVLTSVLKKEYLCGIPTEELVLLQHSQGKWLQYSGNNVLPVSSQQVPEILWSINENLKTTDALLHETFFSALEMLAYRFPREVLKCVLIRLPRSDSIALDIWRRVLSFPRPSKRVFLALTIMLTEDHLRGISTEELVLLRQSVPEILWSIHGNLKMKEASLHETFFSALEMLAYTFPREVLKSALIHLPQCDSTTLDIWKSLLAPNAISGSRVLEELCSLLEDQELCTTFNITTVDSGLLCLMVSSPTEESLQVLRHNTDILQRFLKIKSFPILWLVLRGLVYLSERPETARRIRTLLPDILQALQFDNVEITLKALNMFRNLVNCVGKMEARPIALELADQLRHLFNHEASLIRECSIRLFRDVIEAVAWWQKGKMKKRVLRSLVPLLFRKKDETLSVAQASGEAFVACAKFLKWNKLERQAQENNDPFRIMECLLQQDRRRVNEYLLQSLTYLRDSQTSVKEEALFFIGKTRPKVREKMEQISCSATPQNYRTCKRYFVFMLLRSEGLEESYTSSDLWKLSIYCSAIPVFLSVSLTEQKLTENDEQQSIRKDLIKASDCETYFEGHV
ncbi:UNVERIFIED_CONTAM: hypothetical protein H355_006924 [Colinus virginianus]|nr:hypothetical protein H355_006924 [Colinus virginianus]